MRINSKLIHNLENEKVVILDESTGAEIVFSLEEYSLLISQGLKIFS